ncbi:MAG: TIGR03546 family protein [Treponema sp.]|nr:TIGR03546 family protein [Treponema sp.]
MIKPIAKLIVALNTNLGRDQIAAGFAWGLLVGLIPAGNIFWIVLFAASFFFKHHHWSKMLVMVILQLVSAAVVPLVDSIGWEILYIGALQPFFTALYNMPFMPLTRFNNTLVAGGIVSGVVLWLPAFFLMYALIPLYRNKFAARIKNSKLVQSVKRLPIVSALVRAVETVTSVSDIR